MAAPKAAEFVERSLQQFRYGTKQITGKSGKTYTVPMVRIPAGTALFSATPHDSGFKSETADTVDSQSGMWLSWLRDTALVYSNEGPYFYFRRWFDFRTFTTKRDLDLLDLWTSDGWAAVFHEADANGVFAQQAAFAGLTTTSREDFVQQALDTTMFPGAKCLDPAPSGTPCTTMEWNGLPWGPQRGQFKRSSEGIVDTLSLATLYACFGPDAFDGIFDRPLPSPDAQYPAHEQPYKVFHEEINLRPPFSEKLLVHDRKTGAIQTPQPDPSEFGGEFKGRPMPRAEGSFPPAPPATSTPAPFTPVETPVPPKAVPPTAWKALSDKVPVPPRPATPPWASSSSPGFSNGGRRARRTRRSKKPRRKAQTRKQ